MPVLVYGGAALLGFLCGHFLAVNVMVILTIISIVIGVWMERVMQEMAALIFIIYASCAVVANAAMWITYWCMAGTASTFIQYLHDNLLRN